MLQEIQIEKNQENKIMKSILKSLYQNIRNQYIKDLIFNTFNKHWIARCSVARNPNTPISVLEFLSNDKNFYVRTNVAINPSTSISILNKLSKDKDYYVCSSVVENLKYKKLRNKNPWFYYLKDLFYNLFKKKKRE